MSMKKRRKTSNKDKKQDLKKTNSTERKIDLPHKKTAFDTLWQWLELEKPQKRPPRLGMRAFKSAILLVIIVGFYGAINRQTGAFLACIAGIVAMQDTMGHSVRVGLIRMMGTLIGAIVGVVFTAIIARIPPQWQPIVRMAMMFIGSLVVMELCLWLNFKEAILMGVVVLLAILITEELFTLHGSLVYCLDRLFDTSIGIVLSVILNLSIKPPRWK